MKKTRSAYVSGLVTVIWLLWTFTAPAPSWADTKEQAKSAFMQGVTDFGNENYPGALAAFEKSYKIRKKASVLYNIGMCQKALYRYSDSITSFEKYLKEAGSKIEPQRKTEVEAAISELKQLVGRLQFNEAQAGSEVFINGKSHGVTPFNEPILLDPGRHTVEIKKDGFESLKTDVTSASGAVVAIRAALKISKAHLKVECVEEKGLVFIDGKTVGGCPYEGELEPGTHIVAIEAPSMKRFEKEVEAVSGSTSMVSAALEPEPDVPVVPVVAVASEAQPQVVKSTQRAWQDLESTAKNSSLPREERITAIDDFFENYTVGNRYAKRANSWKAALESGSEPESRHDAAYMRTKKEYFSIKGYWGNYGGGLRIDFSTRRWNWFYMGGFLSGGGGADGNRPNGVGRGEDASKRFWGTFGLSFGVPFHIGAKKLHEIRVGVGIAFGFINDYNYTISISEGYEIEYSGTSIMFVFVPEIYYVWHIAKRFAVQIGADVYVGPFTPESFSDSDSDTVYDTAEPVFNGFIGFRF